MRRAVALLALGALAAGCGSTVQVRSTSTTDGSGLGGAAPVTTGELPGGQVPATAPPSSSAVGAAPGSTSARPVAGAPAPAVVGAAQPPTGRLLPGVTARTITIGVLAADPQANTTMENAGFGAASLGDEPASWRAMADEVNAHGGIAGRKVQLVFHLVNLTDPPAVQGQKACARFTQDTRVAVVLSGYYYSSAHDCLSTKGVPVLLGTNYGVDAQAARGSAHVVAWATPLLDRLAQTLPSAFRGLGRLKPGSTAGLFVVDSPPYARSATVFSAALGRIGVKAVVQTVRDSASGDYAGAATDASSAVLRFRSAGVTEVMFLSHNAFEPALFMQAANSQGYRPAYLLSTQQYPNGLVGLVPAGQLRGAVGVGWAPAVDLTSGYATSPRAQGCLRELKKHGRTYSSATQTLVGLLACDGFELLRRAAAADGSLSSTAALLAAATSARSGFVSAVTIRTAFPSGRRDGVEGYRPLAFDSGCSCFTYTAGVRAL